MQHQRYIFKDGDIINDLVFELPYLNLGWFIQKRTDF